MSKIFKKLYRYYHSLTDMSMLLLTLGLELSLIIYILALVICNITALGDIPFSVSTELSSSATAVMIFSFIFAPITDAIIKCDIKE